MDKVEEVLPGIQKFLVETLAKEKLSGLAQRKRQYYLDRIEVLTDLPEKAPSRPTSVKGNAANGSLSHDFIEEQRKKAWTTATTIPADEPGLYDDLEEGHPDTNGNADDVYEEPISKNGGMSDSGTSYESYDTFDEDEDTSVPSIQLPKNKTKKRKSKPSSGPRDQPINSLHAVTWKGTLNLKTLLSWSKRYCFVNDGNYLCYKNESDIRPSINIPLLGYQVTYSEKDMKQNSQQLRLSKQGCDTYYFSADTKDLAQIWFKHLTTGAMGHDNLSQDSGEIKYENVELEDPTATQNTGPPVSPSQLSSNVSASVSSSEGGSADGSIGQPVTSGIDSQDKKKSKTLSDRFINTFRKKKKVPTATLR